jgi:hypothetical protein
MVTDSKVSPTSGVATKQRPVRLITAVSQTNLIADLAQIPHGFTVERVTGYCSAEAGAVTADVGIVQPGTALQAITLAIGTTKTAFQVTAFDAVAPLRTAGLPPYFRKAAQDNIAFSSAFTVNAAGGAPLVFGAVRVQVAPDGTVSTKVVSADQSYLTAADALAAAPLADEDKVNLGTIVIQVKASQTFTAGTTDLDDATAVEAVTYGGAAAGYTSVLSAPVAFAPLTLVTGAIAGTIRSRAVRRPGGLLVTRYTSDGSGALTQGCVDITYRPFPMNGEA